ncbi:hypothetical protein RchiOBHm_Chr3g0453051 [Rosa chinensis]|uniref:FRIGIDA-like protein n=1 Tax=Rosa chinensis TaxID=74649 RepID=A0A2P6R6F5_ROSCH|nr:FRIGIDA-like protein 4a [Rosa chinensis]PRQ42016.1 hypothetical protein RchiOBHm_Chr3g0453051 [Rosa chinensis]
MEEVVLDLEEWELKQSNLEKAFENCHSLCKKVEEHFNSTRNSFQTQFRELNTREEEIGLREKQLQEKESYFESLKESKEEELDAIEEVIIEKRVQVEQVKTELECVSLLIKEKSQELDSQEKRFLEVEKLVRENERECDLIQNRIEEGTTNLRRIEKVIGEMDVKVKSFRLLEKSMEDWCHKLDLKKKELEGFSENLALKKELLNQTIRELHFIANRVKYCLNEVQRKERELELKETQVESKVEEFKLTETRVNERLNEVELKQKQFYLLEKSVQEEKQHLVVLLKNAEESEKHLDSLQKLVEEGEKDMDSLSHELEREVRELDQQVKDLGLKQTQFDFLLNKEQSEHAPGATNEAIPSSSNNVTNFIPSLANMEESESSLARNAETFLSSNVQPHATSEERNVPGFLEDNKSGNDSTQNELAASLLLVPDPAKLVLNNMQKSLARYLRNGDFEESIMSSNIFILKELMIVSPLVGSHLKADSTTLAAQWKEKMRGNTVNSEESLVFLLFIAMYGLVSMLNVDEIVKLLGLISQNEKALELCHAHGFAAKITDFILILIQKKHIIEAVRFICTFKLIDKLPPIPLLKEYVEDAKKCFEVLCRIRIALDEKVKAVDNLIGYLRAVHQCIKDYNLESEFPSTDIAMQLVRLEKLKENWRILAPSVGFNDKQKEQRKRKEPDNKT